MESFESVLRLVRQGTAPYPEDKNKLKGQAQPENPWRNPFKNSGMKREVKVCGENRKEKKDKAGTRQTPETGYRRHDTEQNFKRTARRYHEIRRRDPGRHHLQIKIRTGEMRRSGHHKETHQRKTKCPKSERTHRFRSDANSPAGLTLPPPRDLLRKLIFLP